MLEDMQKRPRRRRSGELIVRFPSSAAHLARQAWIQMLSGSQRPRPMREEDAARSTDATIAEFSIQLPHGKTLYGEFPVELPSGRKTRALIELGDTLINYCKRNLPIARRSQQRLNAMQLGCSKCLSKNTSASGVSNFAS